jgi:pilus assembly protein CpaB
MFSRRGPVLIVISLLLAVAAAWLANEWIKKQAAPHDTAPNTVSVVTAATEIPFGTKIEARHVAVIQMFKDSVDADSTFRNAEAVEGLVANASILKGELLLKGRFTEAGVGSTLASVVTESMRAVTVRVDDVIGVAGFLQPGNYVDVVSAYQQGMETFSETVVQNVKVLAVDQTASSDKNEPVIVRAVTLEVTPEDAEKLVLAKQRGAIQLALRNPADVKVAEREQKVTAAPAAASAAPAPAAVHKPRTYTKKGPPPPATGVTVIRGTEVAKESPQTAEQSQ